MQPEISERQWREQVVELAQLNGWRCYWTWRSDHSPAGFPDLVLVRGGQLIFAELKTGKGRVSRDQEAWLRDLVACSTHPDYRVRVFVWRPRMFDVVAEVLARPPQEETNGRLADGKVPES